MSRRRRRRVEIKHQECNVKLTGITEFLLVCLVFALAVYTIPKGRLPNGKIYHYHGDDEDLIDPDGDDHDEFSGDVDQGNHLGTSGNHLGISSADEEDDDDVSPERNRTVCNCTHPYKPIPNPTTPKCPVLTHYTTTATSNTLVHPLTKKLQLKQGIRWHHCDEFEVFSKYVKVFDIYVVATSRVPDYKALHTASVIYQYLDNNDDGVPDNKVVHDVLVKKHATLCIYYDKKESKKYKDLFDTCHGVLKQDCVATNIHPGWIVGNKFDEALEETFHLIANGYVIGYPSIMGSRESYVTCLMDCARGGYFMEVPKVYPEQAWYTYHDKTCDYKCQFHEYLFWGLSTYLGANQHRRSKIGTEWHPHTCTELHDLDTRLYELLRDPSFKFPTKLPIAVFNQFPKLESAEGKGSRKISG